MINKTLELELLNGNRWIKDVSNLDLKAKCIDIYDTWRGITHNNLKIGEMYKITHIYMTTDLSYLYLDGFEGDFNSICFEVYLNGKKHNISSDEQCWSDALIERHRLLEMMCQKSETKEASNNQQ